MKVLASCVNAYRSNRIARRAGAVLTLLLVAGVGTMALRAASDNHTPSATQRARRAITDAVELANRMSVDANGVFVAYATEWGESAIMLASLTDESPARTLPVDVPYPCRPAVSPDGRRVAFTSCYGSDRMKQLYVHDVSTGATRPVYRRSYGKRWWWQPPTWTPDGAELVLVHYLPPDGREAEIQKLDPETLERTTLARESGVALRAPSFSPDGKRMAYYAGAHLRVMDLASGTVATVEGAPGLPSPSKSSPDPAAWSPDGRRLAYGRATAKAYEIWVSDLHTGQTRRTSEPGHDSFRPIWTPEGNGLVYLRTEHSERTLWLHRLDSDAPDTPLGFDTGVTYRFAFDHAGRLLALTAPPHRPRTLYWVSIEGPAQPIEFHRAAPFHVGHRWVSIPASASLRSSDGLEVPLIVFPRTCGDAHRPGPGLVVVHHRGSTDISPRWYSEIQYAAAAGLTVVGVNYRGSAGNGLEYVGRRDDIDGQIADVVAAIEYARARPDIDADQLYVMPVSGSAPLAYAAIEQSEAPLRGVIDWVGATTSWTDSAIERRWPSMLWVSATDDGITAARTRTVARLQKQGTRIRHVVVPGDHNLRVRDGRRRALDAIAEFVRQTSGNECETVE